MSEKHENQTQSSAMFILFENMQKMTLFCSAKKRRLILSEIKTKQTYILLSIKAKERNYKKQTSSQRYGPRWPGGHQIGPCVCRISFEER